MELNISTNRNYILKQFQIRKKIEQTPYEDICNLASRLTDKIYTLEGENSNLSSELHSLQRILLTEGSDSAKDIYKKLSNTTNNRQQSTENELQENLRAAQKENNDLARSLSDLRVKLEEKSNICSQLGTANEELNNKLVELNKLIEHLKDENISLLCTNKSLEKQNHKLTTECDNLCKQILNFKRENADRLNAENERQEHERKLKEMANNIQEAHKLQLDQTKCGNPDDFECFEEYYPATIPSGLHMSFDAHEGESCAVYWFSQYRARNDDFLATGGGCDRKVKVWKIQDNEATLTGTYNGSNKSINSIDIEEDRILATSNDYASRIWSLDHNKLLVTLTGHSNKVMAAKFIGRPNLAASCSTDRTVKIWDTNQASCTRTYFAGSACHDLIYFDNIVVSGHFDGLVRCWDIRKPTYEADRMGKLQAKITSLDLSRNGFLLICSLRDNTIKALDIRTMEVLKTFFDDKFKVSSDTCRARFSHDDRYVACGSADGSIFIWDVQTTKLEKILAGCSSSVLACSWSPDGSKLASIEKGKRVSIWA